MPTPKKKESDDFEVWEENWDIVMMFLRMQTQWTVSMAGYVGMRYEVLLVSGGLFDLYDVENRREVLEGLRIIENQRNLRGVGRNRVALILNVFSLLQEFLVLFEDSLNSVSFLNKIVVFLLMQTLLTFWT